MGVIVLTRCQILIVLRRSDTPEKLFTLNEVPFELLLTLVTILGEVFLREPFCLEVIEPFQFNQEFFK